MIEPRPLDATPTESAPTAARVTSAIATRATRDEFFGTSEKRVASARGKSGAVSHACADAAEAVYATPREVGRMVARGQISIPASLPRCAQRCARRGSAQ